MLNEKITELKYVVDSSRYIVFFGGAGVSTESNIPDFRSDDGLYAKKYPYPAEIMLSHSFFMAHTAEFYDFYVNNMIFLEAKPNPAHKALAELESRGTLKAVITQNIDGLHQMGGSKNVYELHGSIHRNFCMNCHKSYELSHIINNKPVPKCSCGGIVKPDVVLYEESLNSNTIDEAVAHIKKADTLIIGGTSLAVYPAASLIEFFKGKNLVVINKSETGRERLATLVINEAIGKVLETIL